MIYLTLFLEFCKIGMLAVGGGLVTIPFLFVLSDKYNWFTSEQLTNMYAISQSIPGPIGNNIAVFAGYTTIGFWGGVLAVLGLTVPAYLIIAFISKYLEKYYQHPIVQNSLFGMRAASVALILFAGIEIAKITVTDTKLLIMFLVSFAIIPFIQKYTVLFIFVAAGAGIVFKM